VEQIPGKSLVEDTLLDSGGRGGDVFVNETSWRSMPCLTKLQASAVGSPDGLLILNRERRQSRSLMVPTQDAIRRLEYARDVAKGIDRHSMVIACTNAHEARNLTGDEDPLDRRYLTGARTPDGFHVYCGSIDAAVRRPLAYAPSADVLCYHTSDLDLVEARSFALAVHGSSPDRLLGVSISLHCGFDHFRIDEELKLLGYSYWFLSVAGSFVPSPTIPTDRLWALVDDSAECGGTSIKGRRFDPACTLLHSSRSRTHKPT
jgi:isocitrate lyase